VRIFFHVASLKKKRKKSIIVLFFICIVRQIFRVITPGLQPENEKHAGFPRERMVLTMASDAIEQIRSAEQQAAQIERDAESEKAHILDKAQQAAAQMLRSAREEAKRRGAVQAGEAAEQSAKKGIASEQEALRRREALLADAEEKRPAAVRRVMDVIGLF
jgi:vacuolar-type H+-ATPase subunit H